MDCDLQNAFNFVPECYCIYYVSFLLLDIHLPGYELSFLKKAGSTKPPCKPGNKAVTTITAGTTCQLPLWFFFCCFFFFIVITRMLYRCLFNTETYDSTNQIARFLFFFLMLTNEYKYLCICDDDWFVK